MKKDILRIIEKHPNGSLITRTRGNKTYYYLNYREAGQVVSNYLGTAEHVDIELVSKKLSSVKHLISYTKAFEKYNKEKSMKMQKQKSDFLHDMFCKIQSIEFFDIPALVTNAKTEEEKVFVKIVSEFALQLKQDAAIKEHRF